MRKGFFELLIASSIATIVIIFVLRFLRNLQSTQKFIVQITSSVLVLEIGLLLLSALQRLNLYQATHGLTRARIFGFIFIVWLSVLLFILLVRILKDIKEKWFFSTNVAATLIILLFVNLFNIDGLIATKYKPTVNDEIDYYYITSLSTDAYEAWIPSINESQQILNKLDKNAEGSNPEDRRQFYWAISILSSLKEKDSYLNSKYHPNSSWQSFIFSEFNAFQFIQENKDEFSKINGLIDKANRIQQRFGGNTIDIENTPLDRSINAPLVR
ncbi:DUF4173 domain-containing protein [Candidatus Daviesbacteria bacterium]|nr:DUF4173 domain-containing protein [Candidatus Daviesbacteria bacterium]